jgi:O-antigen ligase
MYFITKYIFAIKYESKHLILYTLYFILAAAGIFAVLQYFTGIGLPLLFQGNDFEPRRAVSFFTHSNFYALFAAPLLAFLIPDVIENIKFKTSGMRYIKAVAWILGAFGLLLSLSRAGWLGLLAAIVVYIILAGDKKLRQASLWAALFIVVIITFYSPLRHRLTAPFYGEKSASSRTTLWQSGIKAIKQSPAFGLGTLGYSQEYRHLISDQSLPDHNYPHNIFLDLWVETGIIGMVSLAAIIGILLRQGIVNRKNTLHFCVALFLIAFLIQGQIDNPYLKNDLAAVFWIIIALI